ncbi:winged helix-turn-helix domain-containing protein [Microvirga alba]|uniref:Winged helix-turn-helix domain-containing protein n=1 Tax=Microvirga alba TaxID=2791025 RepID=A0A931BQF9_9HYPH|nr:winged helix-turn-helix domain-containing protein [Microvirga alba]MBF9235572.1 winged helix-turn-helix domain-containing protein [Microvirga alba]
MNARDEKLLEFATDRQAECLNAYWTHGTYYKAGKALGIDPANIWKSFKAVRAKAARQGYAPAHDMTHTVPDGFNVKGVSTYYNKDGKPTGQWVKTNIDMERQAVLLREAVAALSVEIRPEHPLPAPSRTLDQLLNCYVITDYHLGAKAWGEETGADWDTEIAENMLVSWFGAAIAQAPDARVGVFAQLGDFMHFDGLAAITPTSGHLLDADTRFQKVIRVAIAVIRRVTSMLLQKHEHVHLLMAEGNHDIASSAWLRELFAALYADEPRITVNVRPDPYYCIEHGSTSLFFHHGHKRKLDTLETTLIAKFRDVFGRTQHSYAHTGHLHHNVLRETNTMHIEQHRTLAAPDSHASRGGWMSGRDAKVITYHADHGEVGRIIVSADMLKGSPGG